MTSPASTLDGLPKQFVSAMRTLFDIMDDKRTGYVNFADIENRWQDDGSKGLPKGVIESLRKVTPPNGLLTFERFCAGLKICLLRNQVEQKNQTVLKQRTHELPQIRPPSAPLLHLVCPPAKSVWNNAATIRSNNVQTQQRTLSMPQLLSERKDNQHTETVADMHAHVDKPIPNISKSMLYGPPKPPRASFPVERLSSGGNNDHTDIRHALQNWQLGCIMDDSEDKNEKLALYNANSKRSVNNGMLRTGSRSMGDGKASVLTDSLVGSALHQKKPNIRRREPRRHTLQNGIDYNMLKRMKHIEQEKDVLMQGLNAIEKAREWYLKQVAAVQEKMKCVGRMDHIEHWSEAQQERLELQRARVLEVNKHLAALADCWERGGLSLHMNLAVHHYPQPLQGLVEQLKQQNHLLTEEVSKKSERIAVLEKEKNGLVRELMQVKNGHGGQEEAVF